MSNPSQQRLYYLDAVRALALLLGVIFHASLSFMPMFIGWAVMDISTSSAVPVFVLISHCFRMVLFFLIAGFFTRMTQYRSGYIASRLKRLGIPFILGWFALRPLLLSGWIMGSQSMQGDVAIDEGLMQGFSQLFDDSTAWFTGTHLWFLYYLLMFTVVAVIGHQLLSQVPRLKQPLTQFADAGIATICNAWWGIFLLALPCAVILWFMQNWGIDTPDKTLTPDWPVTALYGLSFMVGWLLQRNSHLLITFSRLRWQTVALAVVATAACVWVARHEGYVVDMRSALVKVAFVCSYALMMWTIIVLVLGLCRHVFSQPRRWVSYLSDASYWLYLVHLPVVIWLQIAVAELALFWWLKWLMICLGTIAISLLLYHTLVRSTCIGELLNGKRKSQVLTH